MTSRGHAKKLDLQAGSGRLTWPAKISAPGDMAGDPRMDVQAGVVSFGCADDPADFPAGVHTSVGTP